MMILFYFEKKIKKIENNTDVILSKVNALLTSSKMHYPLTESLPDEAILLESEGKRVEACNKIMKKCKCSYAEAESSLNEYLLKNKGINLG